jgi:hypothetical protein
MPGHTLHKNDVSRSLLAQDVKKIELQRIQ